MVDCDIPLIGVGMLVVEYTESQDGVTEWCHEQREEKWSEQGLGRPVIRPLAAGAKAPGFDFTIAQHVQILISRVFTYGAVGSLVLSWTWARRPGFISFRRL